MKTVEEIVGYVKERKELVGHAIVAIIAVIIAYYTGYGCAAAEICGKGGM